MASLISATIDLSKVDKSKIKKNGKYQNYNITISVNDTSNENGVNVLIYDMQTKGERDNKDKKNYLGSGKVLWHNNKITNGVNKVSEEQKIIKSSNNSSGDDLPF